MDPRLAARPPPSHSVHVQRVQYGPCTAGMTQTRRGTTLDGNWVIERWLELASALGWAGQAGRRPEGAGAGQIGGRALRGPHPIHLNTERPGRPIRSRTMGDAPGGGGGGRAMVPGH